MAKLIINCGDAREVHEIDNWRTLDSGVVVAMATEGTQIVLSPSIKWRVVD